MQDVQVDTYTLKLTSELSINLAKLVKWTSITLHLRLQYGSALVK